MLWLPHDNCIEPIGLGLSLGPMKMCNGWVCSGEQGGDQEGFQGARQKRATVMESAIYAPGVIHHEHRTKVSWKVHPNVVSEAGINLTSYLVGSVSRKTSFGSPDFCFL
jgi:hypothetical protein